MKKLQFKYAYAENFLCFGPEGIEINFENYSNIVLIKGKNLDVSDEDSKTSSNGAGKSSCCCLPVYALFGKTIVKPKKLNHHDIINNQSGKKLMVEFRWDDYRVVRTRKPDSLRLWKSETGKWDKDSEITAGGIPATQKLIESTIGLTYDTFINVYIFSDDNSLSFLECDGPAKREIVENLLSLDKYRLYSENAKILLKTIKDELKLMLVEYQQIQTELVNSRDRLSKIEQQEKEWRETKNKELKKILEDIKTKRDSLENTNTGSLLAQYQDAQEQISDSKVKITEIETKRDEVSELIIKAEEKLKPIIEKYIALSTELNDTNNSITNCEKIIKENEKILSSINSKTGKECPYCLGVVEQSRFQHMLNNANSMIEKEKTTLSKLTEGKNNLTEELTPVLTNKNKIEKGIEQAKTNINTIAKQLTELHAEISKLSRIKEPKASVDELLIQQQIDELKNQAMLKKQEADGLSPFVSIKETSTSEILAKGNEIQFKKDEISKKEGEIPYYEFWLKAFGDNGIRKYIIDGIIPALNSRVAYWLQFLIDNKIKLVFDNELKEVIDRFPFNGRPYVYHGMSGGQRRRLNLSVSQAFAHIMMLNSGASPSVVFLDEVSMNMDEAGVDGIYRMICELSKEKQVFVIDHNESLLRMLEGCDVIQLEMKNETTRKVC